MCFVVCGLVRVYIVGFGGLIGVGIFYFQFGIRFFGEEKNKYGQFLEDSRRNLSFEDQFLSFNVGEDVDFCDLGFVYFIILKLTLRI